MALDAVLATAFTVGLTALAFVAVRAALARYWLALATAVGGPHP